MAEEQQKPGSIVHVEIPTKNREKTKKFYGDVFGWKFQDVPEMNYTLFEAPDRPGGGIFVPEGEHQNMILNYLLVNSVDDASREIEKAGGTILRPKQEVPGQGFLAIFKDPEGAVLAIWENAPKAQG